MSEVALCSLIESVREEVEIISRNISSKEKSFLCETTLEIFRGAGPKSIDTDTISDSIEVMINSLEPNDPLRAKLKSHWEKYGIHWLRDYALTVLYEKGLLEEIQIGTEDPYRINPPARKLSYYLKEQPSLN